MVVDNQRNDAYMTNKFSVEQVLNEISALVRGRSCSYKKEISDKSNGISSTKLKAWIEGMLDNWADWLIACTDRNASTGESLAAEYIEARREMYWNYLLCAVSALYVEGRVSSYEGLLNATRMISDHWCVVKEGSSIHNELFLGIDNYDPFKHYKRRGNNLLLEPGLCPGEKLDLLTNLGNKRRMDICVCSSEPLNLWEFVSIPRKGTEEPKPELIQEGIITDEYGIPEDGDDMDVTIDDFGIMEEEFEVLDEYWADAMSQRAGGEIVAMCLPEEYAEACEKFYSLFWSADISVLRTFYEDMEDIVDRYLLSKDSTMLTDADACKKLQALLTDSGLEYAKRLARGLAWRNR